MSERKKESCTETSRRTVDESYLHREYTCPLSNMALMLQPVFVAPTEEQSGPVSDAFGSTRLHFEDNLYSMWKVATKIKLMMADGARFENLTWRAWYRKSQMERNQQSRQQSSEVGIMENNNYLRDEDNNQKCAGGGVLKSEATAIPRNTIITTSGAPNKSFNFPRGYSSILAEIQRAGERRSSLDHVIITNMSGNIPTEPSVESGSVSSGTIGAIRPGISTTNSVDDTSSSRLAEEREKTLDVILSENKPFAAQRKKKKNVDKFIRKQVRSVECQLEKITETTDEGSNGVSTSNESCSRNGETSLPNLALRKTVATERPDVMEFIDNSLPTTTETLSVESLEKDSFRQNNNRQTKTNKEYDLSGGEASYKKMTKQQIKQSSGTTAKVSLLSMLLNREAKRPDSCPPNSIAATPPCRPGAPLPPGLMSPSLAKETTSFSPLHASKTPEQVFINFHNGNSSGSSITKSSDTTTSNSSHRRKVVPNPTDLNSSMYIW